MIDIRGTIEWIKRSAMENDMSLVVLRLAVIVCLLHLNFGVGLKLLSDILGFIYVTGQLPRQFCDILHPCTIQEAI